MSVAVFAGQIVCSFRFFGNETRHVPGHTDVRACLREPTTRTARPMEVVIDETGRAWEAQHGYLIEMAPGEKNIQERFLDPRTKFRANEDSSGIQWRDDGKLVERCPNLDDPMSHIPYDRRLEPEWMTIFPKAAS